MYFIGIDPGVHTGLAVWDATGKRFIGVECHPIHKAMTLVRDLHAQGMVQRVYFEDARLRTWYGNNNARKDRAKLQGAGSVKRDSQIWEDFLRDLGIGFIPVPPKNNATKLRAEPFRKLTGWDASTNEHGRDAAMLVFGRTI